MRTSAIVIGGGHNGLVAACYLARGGFEVTLLERREVLGGAAITEEFAPGFRNSALSYTVSLLAPEVIADLHLHEHGLEVILRPVDNYLPMPDGNSLVARRDPAAFAQEIARHAPADVDAWAEYSTRMAAIKPLVRHLLRTPPLTRPRPGNLRQWWATLARLWRLGPADLRFLLSLFGRSAGNLLQDRFEGEALQAMLGFDSIVGHYASPWDSGTGYVLLHHVVGEAAGVDGAWGHAVGGMGAITAAMAAEARALGVKLVTNADVAGIEISGGQAASVQLADGRQYKADVFAAAIHPATLGLELLESRDVPAEVHEHFTRYRSVSGTLRMNVALSALPRFSARCPEQALTGGIIMAPTLDYMDRAWQDAKAQGWSQAPVVEMLIPSTIDATLAPPGAHVASLFCQHFDPILGPAWDTYEQAAVDSVLDVCERFAPGFRKLIVGQRVYSPWQLEQQFGLVGGDIFHGSLTFDQLLAARPMLGLGSYEFLFPNLYLCGSGAHPGGGVSGLPGKLAAMRILAHH